MSLACGFPAAALPIHEDRVLSDAALGNFGPTDHRVVLGVNELFDPLDEIALQFLLVLQSFLFHARLAQRAKPPVSLVHLVTANVNLLAGKQPEYFAQDTLQKLKALVLARAIDTAVTAGPAVGRVGFAAATELRVGGQRRRGMAGHLDLGNDGDIPRRG